MRAAVDQSGVRPQQIAAIAVDTTCCSVVALDEAGQPLRPCLIWMDVRSAPQTEKVVATGDAALRVNGDGHGPVSAEWMIPKALRLAENEPQTLERSAVVSQWREIGDVSSAVWHSWDFHAAAVSSGEHAVRVDLQERHPQIGSSITLTDVELVVRY